MTGPGGEGTTLGPYQLLNRLGGAMLGDVYLAQPTVANTAPQHVAVKLLRPGANDPIAQQAIAEIQRITALRHRHIIPLYDAMATQDARVGVVMAYGRGGSLADVLAGTGARPLSLPLAPGVVERLAAQLGHALQSAHAIGIVHGDLKPSNIFVRTSARGAPVAALSDFGQSGLTALAARFAAQNGAPDADDWTREQLRFAAPEQLYGDLSPATDQYGLAAVLYYLLTGRPPFMGAVDALVSQIRTAAAPPVTLLNPDMPARIDDILARALAKRPDERFPSLEAFVRTLNDALGEAQTTAGAGVTHEFARLSGARGTNGPAPASPDLDNLDSLPEEAPSRLWRPLVAATIAAVLIGVLTCAIGLYAIGAANAISPSKVAAPFSGPNAAPTIASGVDPSQTTEGQQAEAQLKSTLAAQPIFTDSLASNANQWRVTAGQVYFGPDHALHIANPGISHPVTADAPTTDPKGDYAAQATMKITSGVGGNLAGLRFFVNGANDAQTYYAFFLSPDGQYYLWYYNSSWSFISGGMAPHMNRGDGASNTITVLARGSARQALLFVNGAYVGSAPLSAKGPTSGGAGMIVLNHGVEATYSDFALYAA